MTHSNLTIFRKFNWLAMVTIVLPTVLAIIYFGLLASDVYISESRFVVRNPDKPASTGIGVILKSAGFSNATAEIDAAKSFVDSRDALSLVNKNNRFRNAYSGSNISIFDRFDPLGIDSSNEDLFKYYRKVIGIQDNSASSISTLTVRAYSPEDAFFFNEKLLELTESTVNKLNERGRQDLIQFAQREVDDASVRARSAALVVSSFRNRFGILDPERQAAVQMQMISKLQDELISTKTTLAQIRSISPRNPQVEVLETRRKSLEKEIQFQLGQVAGSRSSLAGRTAEYQRLLLENQLADKQLASALASLEDAKNDARRKQSYVERIVQPSKPDAPVEPRRPRGILSVLVLGLIAYGVLSMLLAGIREHQD